MYLFFIHYTELKSQFKKENAFCTLDEKIRNIRELLILLSSVLMNGYLICHSTYLYFILKNCLCACAHVCFKHVHVFMWVCTHLYGHIHVRPKVNAGSLLLSRRRVSLNPELTSRLWDPGDGPASALTVLRL